MNLLKTRFCVALSTRFFYSFPLLAQVRDLEFSKYSLEQGLPGANAWMGIELMEGK